MTTEQLLIRLAALVDLDEDPMALKVSGVPKPGQTWRQMAEGCTTDDKRQRVLFMAEYTTAARRAGIR
jgi:hypothetical protein